MNELVNIEVNCFSNLGFDRPSEAINKCRGDLVELKCELWCYPSILPLMRSWKLPNGRWGRLGCVEEAIIKGQAYCVSVSAEPRSLLSAEKLRRWPWSGTR